nr:RagB/SusD family nutrient uptake outer membrane protein [uncultured Carboxylicivirga sp.]
MKKEIEMKNIILSITILAFIFSGCNDYLLEENLSNVKVDEFYATEEGYESLVTACYSSLRDIYGDEAWLFCAGTDMYVEGRDGQPEGLSEYRYLTSAEDEVSHLYNTCYKSIQKCNIALYYNDKTATTTTLDQYKGEVLYLRANAYFLLVQSYGGVALILDMISEPILEFNRATAEEVYNTIIADLEDALSLVADDSFSGRVTKRSVQHLLAKVYLTRGYEDFGTSGDFSTAAGYADDAIDGRSLDIAFGDLWAPGNEINDEVLFSVQYDILSTSADPQEMGHRQAYYFGPYMGGSENAGYAPYRSYNLCPTMYLLDLYEETDERWEATFMTNIYFGLDEEGSTVIDYFSIYNGDQLTIAHKYAPKWASTSDDEATFLSENPNGVFHYYDDLEASKSSNLDFETIAIRKFDDPSTYFGEKTSTRDIILSRLGETYLIAAEAYLKANDPTTGLARLNEVRSRAGVADLSSADFDIDAILDERAMELAGEYHRWFDLKRTGTLIDRCVMYNKDIESADYFVGTDGANKILRPIPQEALDLNRGDYKQNPGY